MLIFIPKEILGQIIQHLSRHDIYQLLCSCNSLYLTVLPYLYRSLELGSYIYMRQLQSGIVKNAHLKETISTCTKHLSLKSRQNGNNWRIPDLADIVGSKSQVDTLIFSDFHALSTETIKQIAELLPNLKEIEFRYCHIVYKPLDKHSTIGTRTSFPSKIYRIAYNWTDFTEKSILPSLFSQITHLELGSNRNKYNSVNELMVRSVTQHCPNITHLTIALPQIDESILCDTITHYGIQLQQLSMKCDGHRTLLAISTQASSLESLTVRVTKTDEDISQSICDIVKSCKHLKHLEIESTQLDDDIPDLIWESIIVCTKGDTPGAQNKLFRAQQALLVRHEKCLERNHPKTEMATRQILPLRSNSFWFYTVSEEALEQRYHYNNSLTGRFQHRRNNFEHMRLGPAELANISLGNHSSTRDI